MFARSDDHVEVSVRSLHAQRGVAASLISHLPLGSRALGERSTQSGATRCAARPERIDAEALSATGT